MLKVVLSLLVLVSPAFAAKLLVEPMTCKAVQTSEDGYGNFTMTFLSFKSTKRDGSLVDSLEIQRPSHSDGYYSPLYISDQGVITKNLGGFDEKLRLTAVDYDPDNEDYPYTLKLKGKLTAKGTVVGDTSYRLTCTATVVDTVKRIDDATADN